MEFHTEKRHHFDNEADAVTYLTGALEPYFQIMPEAQMRHLDGTRVRMDMLLLPRADAPVKHRRCLMGIELKAGHKDLRHYHLALKQAIDYRHSKVVDKRANKQRNKIPDYVFVFPAFLTPEEFRSQWWRGSIRLAGMFNVGTIHEVYRWGGWALEFRVSDTVIWRSDQGVVGHINFGTGRKRGAA